MEHSAKRLPSAEAKEPRRRSIAEIEGTTLSPNPDSFSPILLYLYPLVLSYTQLLLHYYVDGISGRRRSVTPLDTAPPPEVIDQVAERRKIHAG